MKNKPTSIRNVLQKNGQVVTVLQNPKGNSFVLRRVTNVKRQDQKL